MNDVVLAVLAGALGAFLHRRGIDAGRARLPRHGAGERRATRPRATTLGNRVAMMVVQPAARRARPGAPARA